VPEVQSLQPKRSILTQSRDARPIAAVWGVLRGISVPRAER
jgi:hypothetical protein